MAKRQREEEQREGDEWLRAFFATLRRIETQKQRRKIEEQTERNDVDGDRDVDVGGDGDATVTMTRRDGDGDAVKSLRVLYNKDLNMPF